ncbi:uncharacterized protein LTR77_003119 [Saxophila tyrrhenica]|uniref:Enoyl reductase (ER) domain-containing protein n=1 Tax=Saxophila tyrrhenica TaxID=1690608 RepID=A0AAV9PJM1_9PEZI|nr:hypothetical protein LTR77_003119 [Saxophila tyrrhenica]
MSGNEIFKPRNVAAWALKRKDRPLVVSKADYTSPPKDYVAIKVFDAAVNPIDWIMQDEDIFGIDYPTVFGMDVAGEIVEVGDKVDEFKIGQRVIAHCEAYTEPSKGGFQKYTLVHRARVAELPYEIATAQGVVLPLAISTASAGLYQKGFLALPYPTLKPESLDRTVIIWGGSSSVGSCAIQLAVASGATVITTASPGNFEYCRKLGASKVFDYHDDDVEDQIVDALKGMTVVGAFHAVGGDGAVQACARIVDRTKGKATVVTVRGVPDDGIPSSVRMKMIGAGEIFNGEVGPYIWREFLPMALDQGTILPKPDPLIVGEELRSVQLGLDKQKKGVSAQKVVITNIS